SNVRSPLRSAPAAENLVIDPTLLKLACHQMSANSVFICYARRVKVLQFAIEALLAGRYLHERTTSNEQRVCCRVQGFEHLHRTCYVRCELAGSAFYGCQG